MGTWANGILDNDAAFDGLGDVTAGIIDRILDPRTHVDELCGAIGLCVQFSQFDLTPASENRAKILAVLDARSGEIAKLPEAARAALDRAKAGGDRRGKIDAKLAALLNEEPAENPFGPREPALFESTKAAAYVQEVASQCVDGISEDFEQEEIWSDLCREAMNMGLLAMLLVLEPCKVSPKKIESWRNKAKKGLETLRKEPDDELEFHEGYYANLDAVFVALAKRFERKGSAAR